MTDALMTVPSNPNSGRKLSLASKILIGLGLGVLTGLFFGELTSPLQIVSGAYLRLMQMTVIPYVAVALITGLGQLELHQAKKLAVRLGFLVLLFWALAAVVIVLLPLTFPEWHVGSFFSTSLVEPKKTFKFIELYIPTNPFHALANGIVPGVVFFSVGIGVALIGIKKKAPLIDGLQIFLKALSRLTNFVVGLTPIGVFAIGAVVGGTMTVAEFSRLQVYFIVFIVGALFLAFWVLPALISTITPFKYKDIFNVTKDALITAFVTHNLFIVIPILIEHSTYLMKKYQVHTEDSTKLVEVIIPVTYNFPTIGKLLSLLFIPFTAWLAGSPLELGQYPDFLFTGVMTYFAKAQTALPFLMDRFEIPQDLFQLYIPTGIINGKFDTLVSAINLIAFSLIGTGALTGYLSFKPMKILRFLIITAGAFMLIVAGLPILLGAVVNMNDTNKTEIRQMQLIADTNRVTVVDKVYPPSFETKIETETTLAEIRQRGVVRVGFDVDRYPFTFYNDKGELVGFDVDLLVLLAADLDVRLEFIPFNSWDKLGVSLNQGQIDIAATIPYLASLITQADLSTPYLEGTVCMVVEDHRRHEFNTLASIQNLSSITVGTDFDPATAKREIEKFFPGIKINMVRIDTLRDFFDKKTPGIDAVVDIAEAGTAWTLLYPEYSIVIPKRHIRKTPVGYAVARRNRELAEFLNDWVLAKKGDGSIRRIYNHWVLGKGAMKTEPRWSLIRNVLKWVD
jgi:Na+/H+-dicarboxylate symporter/ABC-type amino acid transport substrate-binding protein